MQPPPPLPALTPQEQYYLPWNASGLTKEFGEADTADQQNYARLCARGHDIMANHILKWMETPPAPKPGDIPLSEELYREAAQLRRAIEWRPRTATQPKPRAGFPIASNTHLVTSEQIGSVSKRYPMFYEKTEQAVSHLLEKLIRAQQHDTDKALVKNLFGNEYSIETEISPNHPGLIMITVESRTPKGGKIPIAVIAYDEQQKVVQLNHTSVLNRTESFELADKPLKRLLTQLRKHQSKTWTPLEKRTFWHDMGELSLHLYHTAPLQFGSQTATLMILAGMAKAAGLSPAPGQIPTDHFLDAEITPYKAYCNQYHNTFGKNFTAAPRSLTHPLPVNTDFIPEGLAALRASLHPETKTPLQLAQQTIDTLLFNTHSTASKNPLEKPTATDCFWENNQLHLTVEPHLQPAMNAAIDFTGHKELAALLNIPTKLRGVEPRPR